MLLVRVLTVYYVLKVIGNVWSGGPALVMGRLPLPRFALENHIAVNPRGGGPAARLPADGSTPGTAASSTIDNARYVDDPPTATTTAQDWRNRTGSWQTFTNQSKSARHPEH